MKELVNILTHGRSLTAYKTACRSVGLTCARYLKERSGWGTKKKQYTNTSPLIINMTDPQIEAVLAPFRSAVKEQVK